MVPYYVLVILLAIRVNLAHPTEGDKKERDAALDMLIYAGAKGGFVTARRCVWDATADVAAYALPT